jgi:hypothetical protein
MDALLSPIRYIKLHRAHKNRKQTALRMLALSGVVRPSHIELRYTTHAPGITALCAQQALAGNQQTHPIPLPSWDHDTDLDKKQTRQWMHSLSTSLAQLMIKPALFRWSKPLDL